MPFRAAPIGALPVYRCATAACDGPGLGPAAPSGRPVRAARAGAHGLLQVRPEHRVPPAAMRVSARRIALLTATLARSASSGNDRVRPARPVPAPVSCAASQSCSARALAASGWRRRCRVELWRSPRPAARARVAVSAIARRSRTGWPRPGFSAGARQRGQPGDQLSGRYVLPRVRDQHGEVQHPDAVRDQHAAVLPSDPPAAPGAAALGEGRARRRGLQWPGPPGRSRRPRAPPPGSPARRRPHRRPGPATSAPRPAQPG